MPDSRESTPGGKYHSALLVEPRFTGFHRSDWFYHIGPGNISSDTPL